MSTNDPGGVQPEYLGPGSPAPDTDPGGERPTGRGRRTGLVVGAAVAVVAAVGVGGYGLVQLMSSGSSAATAVPANALGYVSLDLDPSASQKIEAFKILRKFPSLKKDLHIGSQDDLRRAVFEQIVADGGCKSLSYADDVQPWIGNRVALAAVPDSKQGALPLVVLQVSDEAKAKKGLEALQECGDPSTKLGISFSGDYALLSEKQADADRMADDAEAASLADDSDFKTWMARTGDPGIVTMYASKDAPAAIDKAQRQARQGYAGSDLIGAGPTFGSDLLKNFQGAAGVIRFHDGAVEAEFATKGLQDTSGADTAGTQAATLPATTAAAFSVAFRDGWLSKQLDLLRSMTGGGGDDSFDAQMKRWEGQTGLQLPQDLETMLGDGVTVSLDSSTDLKALMRAPDPTTIPVGLRISGDPAAIKPIVDKLATAVAGPEADLVKVTSGDGVVAVGADPGYLHTLTQQGDLGDEDAFKRVFPQADRSSALIYVNFDAGHGWADQLADLLSDGDAEAKADIAPLDAFGASGWVDGDGVQHGLVRLTTD